MTSYELHVPNAKRGLLGFTDAVWMFRNVCTQKERLASPGGTCTTP
jgi:hypothetical protein